MMKRGWTRAVDSLRVDSPFVCYLDMGAIMRSLLIGICTRNQDVSKIREGRWDSTLFG